MSKQTVHIIGAGPAGLTAAAFIAKKGVRPIVLEASDTVGGLAGSLQIWGKELDIGPHILLESCQQEAVDFWLEIGGDQIIKLDLKRAMILNRKVVSFPPSPKSVMAAYCAYGIFLAGIKLITARLFSSSAYKSSGDFFQKRYGSFFRQKVLNPYCEKYMGCADANVDLNFAYSLTSFVADAGDESRETDENKLNTILYPSKGTKSMWVEMASRIEKQGEIQFEKKITKMDAEGNKITNLHFEDGTSQAVENVISTLPLGVLLSTLPNVPDELLKSVEGLKSRGTVLVYLNVAESGFDEQYITAFDHSLKVGRLTNFNSWKKQKDPNETIICMEYWCERGDKFWSLSDDEIGKTAISEIASIGLIKAESISEFKILKIPSTHPILDLEHIPILQAVNDYVKPYHNLYLAGRHARFTWDGQADNIMYGKELADKIIT